VDDVLRLIERAKALLTSNLAENEMRMIQGAAENSRDLRALAGATAFSETRVD